MCRRHACAICLVVPSLMLWAGRSQAQVTAGGALIVARTTTAGPELGAIYPPPSGTVIGLTALAAVPLSAHLGLQGELSLPGSTTDVSSQSYASFASTDTTVHRDVILSALLRVRAGSSCNFLVGGGATLSRSTITSVGFYRGTGRVGGADSPFTIERNAYETDFTLTAGAEFPIHVVGRLSVLPTARIHYMFRAAPKPYLGGFSSPLLGAVAFRAGIGGMFAF